MSYFIHFYEPILEFLFPTREKVAVLENLSTAKLLETLPQAESLNDEDIIAVFDYKNKLVKQLVWEIKYKGNRKLADKAGEIIYDILRQELMERNLFTKLEKPLLIPIPISDKRRLERGFNQTELLLKAVTRLDTENLFRKSLVLIKESEADKETKKLSKTDREKNIKNSMRVSGGIEVTGQSAIVLDDVTTSGATFKEARRALKSAGVKNIICIALAH